MSAQVLAAVAAACAGAGLYLLYTALVLGSGSRRGPGRASLGWRGRGSARAWMDQAGLVGVSGREFAAAVAALGAVGAMGAYLLFGGALPAGVAACLAASFPVSAYRRRRLQQIEAAAEAWPRFLEEIRLRTGSLGRSVPQALFEAGRRAPVEWRPAFAAAEREWQLTTDFDRTIALWKLRLADPTADVVGETLALAHEIGGTDLDAKLAELIEDRILDLENRKDAASRQAGVRFARRFVLLVPFGMAVAGLTIGSGRQAYSTAGGQVAVVAGLLSIAGCWAWSGRLMRLPRAPRVFR